MMIKLKDLELGQKAIVRKVEVHDSIKRRMFDIGLIPGSKVECIMKSPLGDPIAYMIKGATIAIRNEDSSKIFVSLL